MQSADPFVTTLQKWIEIFMRSNVRSLIQFSKENDLSMSQVGALFNINRASRGVSNIGDDLGVSRAAASQFLQGLVEKGLINRTEEPSDRRAKHIVLTENGRLMMQKIIHARQGQLEDLARTLSPGEKEQIVAALNILIDKIAQLYKQSELAGVR